MSNVVPMNPYSDPETLLEGAKGQYKSLFMIGYNEKGELEVRTTSTLTVRDMVYMLELFKFDIFDFNLEYEEG